MPDYLMGEFNGGCTAADGCREQPLLAAILQEANEMRLTRGRFGIVFGRRVQPPASLQHGRRSHQSSICACSLAVYELGNTTPEPSSFWRQGG